MHEPIQRSLKALERRGRLRSLMPSSGIDFSSNDYLALARSPELRQAFCDAIERGVAAGSGGSRLLRGNDPEHEALETEAARFFGAESALFMAGGFAANTAIFATLPQRGDLVVYDELIHASVHDGMRSGRGQMQPFRHNDPQACDDVIRHWRAQGNTGNIWIAAETLYSMEGDCASLDDLAQVAGGHDAMLILDEAHATGVFGPDGRGLAHHLEGRPNVMTLHTCGKALGLMGALILGPAVIRDFLVNRARPFIYATAPSPLVAAGVRAALALSAQGAGRRQALAHLIGISQRALTPLLKTAASHTQIQPVIIGADARAVRIATALQGRGFDVRAVRPPTVPEGTARLRISLTLNVTETDIRDLAGALGDELERDPA